MCSGRRHWRIEQWRATAVHVHPRARLASEGDHWRGGVERGCVYVALLQADDGRGAERGQRVGPEPALAVDWDGDRGKGVLNSRDAARRDGTPYWSRVHRTWLP